MRKEIRNALDAASVALEQLDKALKTLRNAELADVGGRLKGVASMAAALREELAERVQKTLHGRAGELAGENFRAVFSIVVSERLDTKALKAEEPELCARYTVPQKANRVTFDAR